MPQVQQDVPLADPAGHPYTLPPSQANTARVVLEEEVMSGMLAARHSALSELNTSGSDSRSIEGNGATGNGSITIVFMDENDNFKPFKTLRNLTAAPPNQEMPPPSAMHSF